MLIQSDMISKAKSSFLYFGHVLFGVGLLAAIAQFPLDLFVAYSDGGVVVCLVGVFHLVAFLLVFFDLLLDLALVSACPFISEDFVLLLLFLLELLVYQGFHYLLLTFLVDFSFLVFLALMIGILFFSQLLLYCFLVFLVLLTAAAHQFIDQCFLLLAIH